MTRYKYLQLHMSDILDDVTQHYQLQQTATNDDYIHAEIKKVTYSLLQARHLAQDLMERRLKNIVTIKIISHQDHACTKNETYSFVLSLMIFVSNTSIKKMLNTSKQY